MQHQHQQHAHGGYSSFPGSGYGQGKKRRPSFPPSVSETIFQHRARRPRIEPEPEPEDDAVEEEEEEESPIEVGVVRANKGKEKERDSSEAESPQEGKSLHSSWEINVKDLVGDAVGNVGPDSCSFLIIG